MTELRVFRLFACCVPVRGARRSTLCDLQRKTYQFIPNGLYEILTKHRGKNTDELKDLYERKFDEEIEEYFNFLISQEFGFWCDDLDAFPDLDLTWEMPSTITNAIVDIGPMSRHNFESIFRQLDDLGCKALQLRFFRPVEFDELQQILDLTELGRLRSIDLLMPYIEGWETKPLEEFCLKNSRISNLLVHSSPEERTVRLRETVQLSWHCQVVNSASHCGEVHPAYFVTDKALFTEGQTHNTCLNRKISIDEHGDIRNCPALPRSFGNARDTSLHSAMLNKDFRELWSINKDQVETCKDCELRYICTDCRALIRDPDDRYSKPSKCTYDPYTAKWG